MVTVAVETEGGSEEAARVEAARGAVRVEVASAAEARVAEERVVVAMDRVRRARVAAEEMDRGWAVAAREMPSSAIETNCSLAIPHGISTTSRFSSRMLGGFARCRQT